MTPVYTGAHWECCNEEVSVYSTTHKYMSCDSRTFLHVPRYYSNIKMVSGDIGSMDYPAGVMCLC